MRKVIFDIDDTAWGLNSRICKKLGTDINKITCYSIRENKEITDEQKDVILKMYSDGGTFDNIEFYDGFEEIFGLEQYECEVYINSNCNSIAVRDSKYNQLVNKLKFPENRVILNVVTDPTHKEIQNNIFILVDDSPFNLAKSKARYNIALKSPWNTSENAKEIIGNKNIIYCDTFLEILDTVKELLERE